MFTFTFPGIASTTESKLTILPILFVVAVGVGGTVARAGAVGGVCSPARGCIGPADTAVVASASGTSRELSSTVFCQNTNGGRQR